MTGFDIKNKVIMRSAIAAFLPLVIYTSVWICLKIGYYLFTSDGLQTTYFNIHAWLILATIIFVP